MNALHPLQHYFGHSSFRPKQWDIVRNALRGKDQLVLMSTGLLSYVELFKALYKLRI